MTDYRPVHLMIDRAAARYGSLRKAGLILKINYAYLSRLRSGQKVNPSDAVLRKLGLRRVIQFEQL